jgi:hypothetical protein
MMFYLECRAGWKRGMLLQTGPEGNALPFMYLANKTDAKL